jgi:hypothetical protein
MEVRIQLHGPADLPQWIVLSTEQAGAYVGAPALWIGLSTEEAGAYMSAPVCE